MSTISVLLPGRTLERLTTQPLFCWALSICFTCPDERGSSLPFHLPGRTRFVPTVSPARTNAVRPYRLFHLPGRTRFVPTVMTSTPASQSTTLPTIELAPSYRIPIVLILAGIAIGLANPWVGGAIGAFGLFLGIQATILRLVFTETALSVTRNGVEFRNFPYAEWQNWRIFWPGFPVLLYFKEINSIHFLPILFDPIGLARCLADRCPRTET